MDSINKKAVDVIAETIVSSFNDILDKLPYDKTIIGFVSRVYAGSAQGGVLRTYHDVDARGRTYKCTALNDASYKVGDKVYLRVPCNDWSNIYIEGKADFKYV